MKKQLLLTIALLASSFVAWAHGEHLVDGIYYGIYSEEERTAFVCKKYGCSFSDEFTIEIFDCVPWHSEGDYSGDIVIPEKVTINGKEYTVTRIAVGAFSNSEGLTSVELPNTVTDVLEGAFFGCKNLKKIKFPKNIRGISFLTLSGCSSLETLDLSGVTGYVQIQLGELTSLREFTLPTNAVYYELIDGVQTCIYKIHNPIPPVQVALNFRLAEGCILYVPEDGYSNYSGLPLWRNSGGGFTSVKSLTELGGASKVEVASAPYSLEGNMLRASGGRLEVYDMEGRLRHVIAEGRSVGLTTGIYLVRGDGIAEKISVE